MIFPFIGRLEMQRHLANPDDAANTLAGKVVAVQDGDTFTLLTDKQLQFKIRLHGIDAPEGGQAFGKRSKQALSDLIHLKRVTVYKRGIDRYRRVVGRVRVNGIDVNVSIVESGYAWWYPEYAPNDLDLQIAERSARAAGRGLWADPYPMAPWEWRKLEAIALPSCCK